MTQRAQNRHADRLEALGVPGDSEATSVDRTEEIHVPFHVALLRSGGRQRFIAVDGVWGDRWAAIDSALTANAAFLAEALPKVGGTVPHVPPTAGIPSSRWLLVLVVLAAGEYLVTGQQLATFLTFYIATLAVLLTGAFIRWRREQR